MKGACWLLAAVACLGCGPSVASLVERGELTHACVRHVQGASGDEALARLFDRAGLRLSMRVVTSEELYDRLALPSSCVAASEVDHSRLVELRVELGEAPAPMEVKILDIVTTSHRWKPSWDEDNAGAVYACIEREMRQPKPSVPGFGEMVAEGILRGATLGQVGVEDLERSSGPPPAPKPKPDVEARARLKELLPGGAKVVVAPRESKTVYVRMGRRGVPDGDPTGIDLVLDFQFRNTSHDCVVARRGRVRLGAGDDLGRVLEGTFDTSGRALEELTVEPDETLPLSSHLGF